MATTDKLRKIVIAGGSGFLGRLLVDWFGRADWDVVVLTRQVGKGMRPARSVVWDGESLGHWEEELEGCDALVNLAGVSVNCRYHARNRRPAVGCQRLDGIDGGQKAHRPAGAAGVR